MLRITSRPCACILRITPNPPNLLKRTLDRSLSSALACF